MPILNQFKPAFLVRKEITTGPFRHMFNFRRIWQLSVLLTSLVTLLPLIVITTVDYNFTQKSIESENLLRTLRVGSNARRVISSFLSERKSALSFIVEDNTFAELNDAGHLSHLLKNLQASFGGFIDLGVITKDGRQSNYVGPYELAGKDYSQQEWFKEVIEAGFHISDVFLGFRNTPHLVISVKHGLPGGDFFVLRTAIDTNALSELLANFELTGRGDAFLVNHAGVIQTPSRHQLKVFAQSPFPVPKYSDHTEIIEVNSESGEPVMICSAYIPDSPFILIIVKYKDDLMQPWRETRVKLIGFLIISITLILIAIVGFSTYMVNNMYLLDQRRLNTLHEAEYCNKLASIGRLAAGVAHEINNPLAIINEKAGLIQDLFTYNKNYTADPRVAGLLESILSSVERCGTITKRLLSFARHMDSLIENVQPVTIITEVLSFLKKEAEYRNIVVNLDPGSKIPVIRSDRGKLQQVFLNIINNAFAAMDVGGRLDITVRYDGSQFITITISDNGCGISEADLGRIFEPFFSTKTKSGGTGLGLSITYGLIQELGGRVQVSSELGKGTRFDVALPLQPPHKMEK